jgi:hypothetical protein
VINYKAISRLVLVLAVVPGFAFAQRLPGKAVRPAPARLQQPAQVQPRRATTAEEMPPVAPQVTCTGGLVTLNAQNSTLASVMRAVSSCTNTAVDMPSSIGVSRVFAQLGPSEPAAIYAALLDGPLDYVILGSTRDPARVRIVIVKTRGTTASGSNPAAPPQVQPVARQIPVATFVDEKGVERLKSGLTPDEALLSAEELAQKFEAARAEQRIDDGLPPPDPQ